MSRAASNFISEFTDPVNINTTIEAHKSPINSSTPRRRYQPIYAGFIYGRERHFLIASLNLHHKFISASTLPTNATKENIKSRRRQKGEGKKL